MTAFALRYRQILLPALAALLGWLTELEPPDLYRFSQFGDLLMTGHLGQVYAGTWNQAGPLQLVLARLLLVGSSQHSPSPLLVAAIDAGLTLVAMRLCRARQAELIVGVTALLWFALPQPWNGHPIELLIAVSWLAAVSLQRQGRSVPAALSLALGVAIAPWAVLGFPVLLAIPGPGRAVRTGALSAGLAVGCYLPFALTGHFGLFGHDWPVDPDSAVHLLAPGLHDANWLVRLAQAALTAGGCAAIAWRYRGDPRGYYLAPFAAGVLRVASDPVVFGYYWTSVAVVGVVVVARMEWARPSARWVAVAGFIYLPWAMAASTSKPFGGPLVGGLACLAALVWLLRYGNRPAPVGTAPVRDDARYGVPANAG